MSRCIPTPLARLPATAGLATLLLSAAPAPAQDIETITVFGTTPVRAEGTSMRDFPGTFQSATAEQLAASGSADISSYLSRRFGGVHFHSAQGNPLQSDLYFRGYAASPLLGLPMGLTVYQNGVRLNEPLGDAVNWDLVPMNAIASLSLLGGANPLYGLNTLGGSVVVQMKNGFSHPRHSVEVEGGSYGRAIANIESGGNNGDWAYYVNAQRFEENGWRDLSPSWTENLYGSVDWRGDRGALGLNYHRARSDLTGNGLSPVGLLAVGRERIFSAPDITRNDTRTLALRGDYALADRVNLSANLYYRGNDTESFNGDGMEEDEVDELIDDGFGGIAGLASVLRGACRDAVEDELGEPLGGNIEEDEFGEAVGESGCSAINNLSGRGQDSRGGVVEIDAVSELFGLEHDLTAGAGLYRGSSDFNSRVQFALFDPPTRSTTTSQAVSGGFADERTEIDTEVARNYVYVGDRFSLGEDWSIMLSGFYHDSRIELRDRTGEQPQLNGEHDFGNFNWGVGAVRRVSDRVDLYGAYNESSRLPTPIELACSEELSRNPITGEVEECRLPNAFLADPPLDEVIARNLEFGVRGALSAGLNWSLGLFRPRNENDIFWQTGQTRAHGLFKNIDNTRRLGLEASLAGAYERWRWNINYTYIKATFEDNFDVLSQNHPANAMRRRGDDDDDDEDESGENGGAEEDSDDERGDDDDDGMFSTRPVRAGAKLPGIPDHMFKAAVE
ncbi:MAG: TonB-dependent receptor plug domain-containing protein, partial [Proteobacteria bacterium]|nr:TonB-dependent receptor plug domain-containing protein [Pseudomonadota bacterium]